MQNEISVKQLIASESSDCYITYVTEVNFYCYLMNGSIMMPWASHLSFHQFCSALST